jgi:DNA repair exonuclease SbcCD ATPase subunit
MLKRMEKRLEDEKARLERISALEGRSTTVEQIEAEVMSLADEMADITMLQAHMDALSDEVSSIIESFNLSDAAKERGLAAKALRAKLDEKERELAEIKSKEEQLAGREEMVDRKIKAYASKKKQLDDQENDLKSRLEALENERLELEKIRLDAVSAKTQGERDAAKAEWDEEKRRLRHRLIELRSVVSPRTGQEPATEVEVEKAEADIEGTILELDRQVRELLVERSDLQKRMADAIVIDEDLKRLLRVLDQLLGQLPEDIISKFSSSEDFALYERILDRMKI